jgi:energy-coupling factor transport system ATP-binding protein
MEDDVLRERVRWAMEAVGLGFEAFKDRLTWSLSGGEQRKVALAGVLALQPRILVLDEPTAGLDPVARQELLSHLGRLYSQGTALVVASHNMADIAALTQRVYVLNAGHIAAEGPTRQILTELKALQALGLDVPPITKIMTVLRQRGLDVPVDVLTLTEAEAVLLNWLEAADTAERAGAHG